MAEQASSDSDMTKLLEMGLVFLSQFVCAKEDPTERMLKRVYKQGTAFLSVISLG